MREKNVARIRDRCLFVRTMQWHRASWLTRIFIFHFDYLKTPTQNVNKNAHARHTIISASTILYASLLFVRRIQQPHRHAEMEEERKMTWWFRCGYLSLLHFILFSVCVCFSCVWHFSFHGLRRVKPFFEVNHKKNVCWNLICVKMCWHLHAMWIWIIYIE